LLKRKELSVGRIVAAVMFVAVLLLAAGCGEEREPAPLLRIGDEVFGLAEFREFLRSAHPSAEPPINVDVLEAYLEEFLEHRLLVQRALAAGMVAPREIPGRLERENILKSRYIAREANRTIEVGEESVMALYEERYREPRARIRCIYVEEESTANSVYSDLRRRPSGFEQYMERYNPEEFTAPGIGTGVYSRLNMPEEIGERVFALQGPGIAEPVPWRNGYIIAQVEEFLERPTLDEVRDDLEDELYTAEWGRVKRELIERGRGEVEVELNPRVAIEAMSGAAGEGDEG